MAKTNAEKCKTYYLKNKQKIKAKYKEKNGQMYYTFNGILLDKQLFDKLNFYIENTPQIFFDKHDKKKVITERLKNDLFLAATYMYKQCKKNKHGFVRMYMRVIKRRSNMLPEKYIRKLVYHISDLRGSVIRKDNGTVFFLANEKNEVKKVFDRKEQVMKEHGVVVRDFRFTNFDYYSRNEQEINGLKMSYKTLKEWNLCTYPELLQTAYSIVDQTYQKIDKKRKKTKVNYYEGLEEQFVGFHSSLTENEKLVIERYKTLKVEERKLIERIQNMKFDKNDIELERLNELCQVLSTLQQREITFSHGRLYYPMFTKLNKDWRDVLTLNGKHLKQLFDIPTCHSTKSLILYSKSKYRNEDEVKSLYEIIIYGDIYTWIGTKIGWKEIDADKREELKEYFNRWLFLAGSGRNRMNGVTKQIDKKMKELFPTFREFITQQQEITIVDQEGKQKQKSTLAVQCEWLQNKLLINGLFNQVKHLTTITLHDAIFIAEDEYSKELAEQLEEKWKVLVTAEIFVR